MGAQPAPGVVRLLEGAGAFARVGEEAAAIGARALIVSPAHPDTREVALLQDLGARLRAARVGSHPFPRVPRPGTALDACLRLAAEAARESRCRLVVGLGDTEPLQVARWAAGSALLPSLVVPTVVGYGPADSGRSCPLPDVLISDPATCRGSAPRRTAVVGLQFLTGLLERYAGNGAAALVAEAELAIEEGMRLLIDALPAAIATSDDPAPRVQLALATARAAEGMAAAGPGPTPIELAVMRLPRGGSDVVDLRAMVLPAAMESCGDAPAALNRERVARFGRQVLGIREADDGRAASWAAGGIQQWVRNLGFATRLPAGSTGAGPDPALREILSRTED